MGKFVIIPFHPSNTFFEQFSNCLMYKTKAQFVSHLQHAISNEPEPLSEDHTHQLTWEAATERCMDAAVITRREAARRERVGQVDIDNKAAEYLKGGIFEVLRKTILVPMMEEKEEAKSSINNIDEDVVVVVE